MEMESKRERHHREILQILNEQDSVELVDLCRLFSCCETTVRNDLRYLEERGDLIRTFGGATKKIMPKNIVLRSSELQAEKKCIAAYCMKNFIKPGETVMLDAGSTCATLAYEIAKADLPVNVITNSYQVANALVDAPKVQLNLIGGRYNAGAGSFFDETSEYVLETMRANVLFFGAKGIRPLEGYFISDPTEAALKRKMIQCSYTAIALMDHTKIGATAFKYICNAEDIGTIVTDDKADQRIVNELRAKGVEVLCINQGGEAV